MQNINNQGFYIFVHPAMRNQEFFTEAEMILQI